jgi:hypothetical protein
MISIRKVIRHKVHVVHGPTVHGKPEEKPPIQEPGLQDMLSNFGEAAKRAALFAKIHGVSALVVEKSAFEERLETCRACPKSLWEEDARAGLGRCKHIGCGCTKLKLWLASEKCPIAAWR